MTCFFCSGSMEQSFTTHFAQLENGSVIIKNVPCLQCSRCGEIVYTAEVTRRLDEIIGEFAKAVTEVAVVNYSAA